MSPLLRRRPSRSRRATASSSHADNSELAAVVGPSAVVTAGSFVKVGSGYAATLVVSGYPAEVGMAWLEPVLAWAGRLDVALHIEPLPTEFAAGRLRRQRARLESSRRLDADRGRLDDPLIEAAADDAAGLADRLARGEARLFRVGLYLTVHAPTRALLADAVAEVRAAAASVLLDTHPATWRHLAGWCSTLPLGHDGLDQRRVMDTDALAAAFPLACPDLPGPLPGEPAPSGGVLYGINTTSGGIVWWDRWAQDNHNAVVLARSGAGKSYLVKLDVLRQLYAGVAAHVIDPEDEYTSLADAVGGTVVRLGAPDVRVNPFDLPHAAGARDALTRRALFLHTLIAVLLGEPPPPAERAALDKALTATYTAAGITHDPTTWTRPAPVLADLAATLTALGGNDAATMLAARLSPWVEGSFKDLFAGPTTTRPAGQLVVWSTRHLPDELRAAGMLLALDAIWRDIDQTGTSTHPTGPADRSRLANPLASSTRPRPNPLRRRHPQLSRAADRTRFDSPPPRRLVVVDEAWTLMREHDGARFLARMAKSARKRHAGLTVVTQDAADLLGSDLGQVVLANAATQILLRQAPQAIDAVADAFHLTIGEARLLLAAPQGEALLIAGTARVAYRAVASPTEHHLITAEGQGLDDDAPGHG
ncbi:MAG: hypothetical protein JNL54_19720 [Kineosporiaceae bacterium]|nr:hypothetical protein [Kineosporiaceae bacterium]